MYGHVSDGERLILLQLSALSKNFRNHQNRQTPDNRNRVHVCGRGKAQALRREMRTHVVTPEIDNRCSSELAEDHRKSYPTNSARVRHDEGHTLAQRSKDIP